jgi:hypothetical protein
MLGVKYLLDEWTCGLKKKSPQQAHVTRTVITVADRKWKSREI